MRTTVDLPEGLVRQARDQGCTLADLLEAGLREAIACHRQSGRFVLRDASVPGSGLTAEFASADAETIQAAGLGGNQLPS